MIDVVSLTAMAAEQVAAAHASSAGRSARAIHSGADHALRQTVLALVGHRDEHRVMVAEPARPCRHRGGGDIQGLRAPATRPGRSSSNTS